MLVKYDDQIYLLHYFLRNNFEDIIEAYNDEDRDKLKELVTEHLKDEFEVTDEKAISQIIDLFFLE